MPVPKRLGEEIGYPVEYTLIGQGQHVLEAVKPRGRGIVKRLVKRLVKFTVSEVCNCLNIRTEFGHNHDGYANVSRPNDETPYETFTGIPFDPEKQYQPSMTKDAETKYRCVGVASIFVDF